MRKVLNVLLLWVCVLCMGCAATVKRPTASTERLAIPMTATADIYMHVKTTRGHDTSEDWELFRAEWRTAMAATASAAGRRFVYLDSLPEQFDGHGTLVVLDINDYRYLSPGARYALGVMSGNAYIDLDAEFYVLPDKTLAGKREYATSSSAWQGVFSAMTEKQVAALTAEILNEIDGK